jgi:hypothetical protein
MVFRPPAIGKAFMKPKDIDRFFSLLGQRISFPLTVILTGGGAAILEGVSRATRDLDFQIVLRKAGGARQEQFQRAVAEVEGRLKIAAQYDASIETWSSIVWPSPRPKSRFYKRFGSIHVRILDPLWWSVGKIARYLSYDVSDVVTVFRKMKVRPEAAARAWGKALGRSPLSNAQPPFKRQALAFFDHQGRRTWGTGADIQGLHRIFLDAARKAAKNPNEG